MKTSKSRFSIGLALASLALGRGFRSDSPVTLRACYAPSNTCSFPRKRPKITPSDIVVPWAASVLRVIHHAEAWYQRHRLESLRIGLCEDNDDDEVFVSLYEASQLPRRWGSDEHLPLEWQCDELIARLVREGKNPVTLRPLDMT